VQAQPPEVSRMSEYKVIGHSVRKLDAVEKVLGTAKYAADIQFPAMIYGKTLRSKVAHGVLLSVDCSKAKALPGVVAVLTGDDVPGANTTGIILKDEPVLVKNGQKIRKIGDPIALVAAETEELAEQALDLIEVKVEELPAVFDPVEAMKNDAPKIYEKGNLLAVRKIRKGDAEKAFGDCAVIIEQDYRTQMTEHAYIEPEAGVAKIEGELLTIWVCTQNPHYDAKEVARNLNIGLNRVRVIQAVTGGGFGGKLDISVQVHLALLAMATRRPVKMIYSRHESIANSVKRHPFIMKMKTGADATGKILAFEASIIGDTGAYASYGPGTLTRSAVHVMGPYEVPNVKVDAYTVYTNNPQAGAMRGFGVPQVAFAHESQMDILAEKVGVSPLKIRLINALRPGSVTGTGTELKDSVGIVETLEAATAGAKKTMELNW
jgi:CO/xanthine dehydrogenase Mo-binding subunit